MPAFDVSEADREILDWANERYECMNAGRSRYDGWRLDAWDAYNNLAKPPTQSRERQLCKYHIPIEIYDIDHTRSELMMELLSRRPIIPVEPGGDSEEDVYEAKITEAVFDYQLTGPYLQNFLALVYGFQELSICDCAVWKTDWTSDKWYDGPRLRWIPLSEFWMDEHALHASMARDMIFQSWFTKRDLERWAKSNFDEAKQKELRAFLDAGPEMETEDQKRKSHVGAGLHNKSGRYRIWEFWGDDGRVYELGVRGDRAVIVLRSRDNPFKNVRMPAAQVWTTPDLAGGGGVPMHQKLGDIPDWLDTVVRQWVDAGTLQNIPRFLVDASADIDLEELARPYPGQGIISQRGVGKEVLQAINSGQDRTPQILQAVGYIHQIQDEVWGLYRGQRGAPRGGGGSDTATEVLSLQGQSNLRMSARELLIQNLGLRPLGYNLAGLDWQYMDQAVWVKITDAKIGEMMVPAKLKRDMPRDARRHFNIIPAPHLGTENKQITRQRYTQTLNMLLSNPFVAPNVKWETLLPEALREMLDLRAPERFIRSRDDAMMQMMAMQNAQGGGGGAGVGATQPQLPGQGALTPSGAGSPETGLLQRMGMGMAPPAGLEGLGA